MKPALYFFLLVAATSCNKVLQDNADPMHQAIVKDTIAEMDKDEHGCLASAGYIWSKVGHECVKLYSGIALNPVGQPDNTDPTLAAFVLFSQDQKKAEVFLPNTDESDILLQSGPQHWENARFQLHAQRAVYQLMSQGHLQYEGDAEKGLPVEDTDQGE